jgi:hypothetical protein
MRNIFEKSYRSCDFFKGSNLRMKTCSHFDGLSLILGFKKLINMYLYDFLQESGRGLPRKRAGEEEYNFLQATRNLNNFSF